MIVATICARGGSVGVPRKNIRPLMGKPLIAYSIEQALACRRVERVYVSTDDLEIAEVARQAGARVPFLRPAEMATSIAPKIPVIEHLVAWIEANDRAVSTIVDLDPSSPLREVSDIDACISLLEEKVSVVISGYETDKNPYFNVVELQADGSVQLVRKLEGEAVSRQTAPKVYAMNASVYVWRRAAAAT